MIFIQPVVWEKEVKPAIDWRKRLFWKVKTSVVKVPVWAIWDGKMEDVFVIAVLLIIRLLPIMLRSGNIIVDNRGQS